MFPHHRVGLLTILLLCACQWDVTQFIAHPTVEDRMRENLSGALHAPGPTPVNPDSFRFAIFGDPQIGADGASQLGRFRQDVARLGIDFFCVAGDLTEDATAAEHARLKAQLDSVGVPCYCTVGNHHFYQSGAWNWFNA